MISNIIEIYQEKGLKGLIERVFWKLLYFIGIRKETDYFCVYKINLNEIIDKLKYKTFLMEQYEVRQLYIEDFRRCKKQFSQYNMSLFEDRLKQPDQFQAYGVLDKGQIIYYSWVYLGGLILPYNTFRPMNEQGLLFDDFCDSKYRGQGIHGMMILYRIKELANIGLTSVAITVAPQNTASLKPILKAGFKIAGKYTTWKIWKKIIVWKH